MLGCQLDFHRPASSTSCADVSYVQGAETPGKVHLNLTPAVAIVPWTFTRPTWTFGASGPMPATRALSSSLTAALFAPENSTAETSFLANPAASSAAARSAVSSTGDGVGTEPPRVHPSRSRPVVRTMVTARKRTGPSCLLAGGKQHRGGHQSSRSAAGSWPPGRVRSGHGHLRTASRQADRPVGGRRAGHSLGRRVGPDRKLHPPDDLARRCSRSGDRTRGWTLGRRFRGRRRSGRQ